MIRLLTGYAKHVGMYPVVIEDSQVEGELAPYLFGKSTMKFMHDQPLPADLITRYIAQLST